MVNSSLFPATFPFAFDPDYQYTPKPERQYKDDIVARWESYSTRDKVVDITGNGHYATPNARTMISGAADRFGNDNYAFRISTRNIVTNQGFENDKHWAPNASYSTDVFRSGTKSLKIASNGTSDINSFSLIGTTTGQSDLPCKPGDAFYCEIWVFGAIKNVGNETDNTGITLAFRVLDSANTAVAFPFIKMTASSALRGVWTKMSGVLTIPAGTGVKFSPYLVVRGTLPAGDTYYFDDPIIQPITDAGALLEVNYGDNAGLPVSGVGKNWSFAAWVKTDNLLDAAGSKIITEWMPSAEHNFGLIPYGTNGFRVRSQFLVQGSSKNVTILTPQTIPFNEWHHVVEVCDGKTATIYTNGEVAATQDISGVDSVDYTRTLLGYVSPRFDLDDVRIYNKALTSLDVQKLYRTPNPVPTPTSPAGQKNGRFRFIVEEAITGEIVSKDLVMRNPKVLRALSGPCQIQGEVNMKDPSAEGINFRPWSHWIHVEKLVNGKRKIIASGLVQPSQTDSKTGNIMLVAQGFSAYPRKKPWLENWNPLACDAFEPVHKIWDHLQSFANGDLGVEVYPLESGVIMLPGYAFDGNIFDLNFWAMFIRAADKQDCQDNIDKLARDIPFDYVEQSEWSDDYTYIKRKIFLGYPKAGIFQENLAFILHENVIEAKAHLETEIDWASDVIVDGWWPGTIYSTQLSNADQARYRNVIAEDDARINSQERAAAWSRRKLTRRQTPAYFDSIIVDMEHPNAPFGTYDVGDRIMVHARIPIAGQIVQEHKIIAISVDEENQACELTLKAEGAFNYDPIYYQGDIADTVTVSHAVPPIIAVSAVAGTTGVS